MTNRNRAPKLNNILVLFGRSKVAYNKCKTIAKHPIGRLPRVFVLHFRPCLGREIHA